MYVVLGWKRTKFNKMLVCHKILIDLPGFLFYRYPILLPGRKSGFRPGFRPDFQSGKPQNQPSGRPSTGWRADFEALPMNIPAEIQPGRAVSYVTNMNL